MFALFLLFSGWIESLPCLFVANREIANRQSSFVYLDVHLEFRLSERSFENLFALLIEMKLSLYPVPLCHRHCLTVSDERDDHAVQETRTHGDRLLLSDLTVNQSWWFVKGCFFIVL